jgi:DNA adenine methylase
MQYVGGKSRIASHLCTHMWLDGKTVWEPFCGSLAMSCAMSRAGAAVFASDASTPLLSLYEAVREGWDPPDEVGEELYKACKSIPDTCPLKAFAGFGCSFGAKWFGGYARSQGGNFAGRAKRALLRDCHVPRAVFRSSFFDILPGTWPELDLLYLDPPYAGTLGYASAGKFDSAAFWARAYDWSLLLPVYVSEYSAPPGWLCVYEREQRTTVARGASKPATERLFFRGPGC